jgi:hypothetical protein
LPGFQKCNYANPAIWLFILFLFNLYHKRPISQPKRLKQLISLIWKIYFSQFFLSWYADMGSMYLKPWKIRIGYALYVVEFATAVCADKQKGGLPLALFIGR